MSLRLTVLKAGFLGRPVLTVADGVRPIINIRVTADGELAGHVTVWSGTSMATVVLIEPWQLRQMLREMIPFGAYS